MRKAISPPPKEVEAMTERQAQVVVEVLSGPLDGYRCAAEGAQVSVGDSVSDDVTVADDHELAAAKVRLEVLTEDEVRVTAVRSFSVGGEVFEDEATARSGAVIRAGSTEFKVVEAHVGSGGHAGGHLREVPQMRHRQRPARAVVQQLRTRPVTGWGSAAPLPAGT